MDFNNSNIIGNNLFAAVQARIAHARIIRTILWRVIYTQLIYYTTHNAHAHRVRIKADQAIAMI